MRIVLALVLVLLSAAVSLGQEIRFDDKRTSGYCASDLETRWLAICYLGQ